jgi:hypothetical protein
LETTHPLSGTIHYELILVVPFELVELNRSPWMATPV